MEQAGHTHPDKSPPKSRDFNRERGERDPKSTPQKPPQSTEGGDRPGGGFPKNPNKPQGNQESAVAEMARPWGS